MPIYEYHCEDCKDIFEEQLSIKVDSKVCPCPKCKKECKKIPSRSSFVLVGGGWFNSGGY